MGTVTPIREKQIDRAIAGFDKAMRLYRLNKFLDELRRETLNAKAKRG